MLATAAPSSSRLLSRPSSWPMKLMCAFAPERIHGSSERAKNMSPDPLILRAGPNADDEELRRLVGGDDLAMHHPGGSEDEVPGHRRHLLAPARTVFDRHPAAENVDVGIALSMVCQPPASPASVRSQPTQRSSWSKSCRRSIPGVGGPGGAPSSGRTTIGRACSIGCSPRRLAWAPCPTLGQTSGPRTCAGPERYTVSPTGLGFHTRALSRVQSRTVNRSPSVSRSTSGQSSQRPIQRRGRSGYRTHQRSDSLARGPAPTAGLSR